MQSGQEGQAGSLKTGAWPGSQRRRAEQALAQERDFAEAVLDSLPGIFYCYDENLRFVRWNKNFERVSGYSAAEIAGMSPLEFFTGADRELIRARIAEVFARGESDAEAEFVAKDGTRTPYYFTGRVTLIGGKRHLVGVGIDLTERKQTEEALRALTARLLEVREEERAGIARELHDQLGQALTGLKLDLAWLDRRLAEPSLRAKTAQMVSTIDEAVQAVRRISSELRPGVLDNLGLAAAIEWQAAEFEQRTGIRCAVSAPAQPPKLEAARATAVFRIFQEALTNVARHAGASHVQIQLREVDGQMELTIADNGRGISEVEGAAQSLGLLGMRERAAAAGGRLAITGAPGQGTTLRVTVPISEP